MSRQCECIVMSKHKRRCEKIGTKQCVECGEIMCSHCSKNHHAHNEFIQFGGKHAGPLPF